MTRRLSQALLLALLLLAVQTAILTHEHDGSPAPTGLAAQGCDFCAGHHGGAPLPATLVTAHPEVRPVLPPAADGPALPATRFDSAHPSRAPPLPRSC